MAWPSGSFGLIVDRFAAAFNGDFARYHTPSRSPFLNPNSPTIKRRRRVAATFITRYFKGAIRRFLVGARHAMFSRTTLGSQPLGAIPDFADATVNPATRYFSGTR